MAWFPSIKGEHRMVPLHRFSHIPMAELLEADPSIDAWHSNTAADMGDTSLFEDADFVAYSRGERIIYRIKRAVMEDPGDVKRAFMDLTSDRRVSLPSEELAKDLRLPAARTILRLRNLPLAPNLLTGALGLASRPRGPRTLGALRGALGAADVTMDSIFALIGKGHIRIALTSELNGTTPITGVSINGWR